MDLLYLLSLLIPLSNLKLAPLLPLRIMLSFASLFLVGSLAFQSVLSLPGHHGISEREAEILKRDVDSFIITETPIAYAGIICNIGTAGSCVQGAGSGLLIASPSRNDPPCEFDLLSTVCSPSNTYRFLYLDSRCCFGLQGSRRQIHSNI